jgi:tripartite-type tricarboxylate transporter receptor subunit TctC
MISEVLRLTSASALAALILLAPAKSVAQGEVAAFYSGKTVRLIVGYPSGSTFDTYSRALSRHMRRHIPGQPNIIVQNMPGAGSLTATNYMAHVAPKDGLAIGMSNPVNTVEPLLNPQHARFDPRKFSWIGSMNSEINTCAFWGNKVSSAQDLSHKQVVVGTTGPAAGSTLFAQVLAGTMRYNFKMVPGYPGLNEVQLAALQGEVDGHCGLLVSSLKTDYWDEYKKGTIKIPLQMGVDKHPDIADVPNVFDLVKSEEDRQVLLLSFGPWKYGRPVFAPEGIPADRLSALRAAFAATMKDPEFLSDAQKIRLEIQPVGHEEVGSLLAKIYATPADVVERTRKIIGAVK